MIVCRTLGPIEVMVDEAPAMPDLLWRKHLALLIYLVRSMPRARSREHLIRLLWPDKPEPAGRHSLAEAIRVLRRYGGEASIESAAGNQVRLSPGSVRIDLDQLSRHAERKEWAAAAALVSGEFMEGFSVPGASEFEDWLLAERDHWRTRSVAALVHHADELERKGNPGDGAVHALRALRLDPRSEQAIRSAMRCLALSGDRAGALQRYDEFQARMLDECGMQPDRETTMVAERIRRERDARPTGTPEADSSSESEVRPPLVEREAELARLLAAASQSRRQRRAAALIVEGDAGHGKSRLLEELVGRLRLEGVTVVIARAVEGDLEDACGGIIALARGGLVDAPGLASAPPVALGALARDLAEWGERFPSATKEPEPLPLRRALLEVLRATAEERPIALVLDDAHWLDQETALVLGAALRDLGALPVAVILALQPRWPRPELDEIRSRIGRDLAGVTVPLTPLGRDGLSALARHFLPDYSDLELDRVVRRVTTDSAGIPFLVVELLRAVAFGMNLESLSGAWPEPSRTLDQTLPGDLPDAIAAALRVTFRLLSPKAQAVLAAAAVIGDRVEPGLLAQVSELPVREVEAALDELEWHQWLAADPRGYSFTARLARQVIERDMLTEGHRQRILAVVQRRPGRSSIRT